MCSGYIGNCNTLRIGSVPHSLEMPPTRSQRRVPRRNVRNDFPPTEKSNSQDEEHQSPEGVSFSNVENLPGPACSPPTSDQQESLQFTMEDLKASMTQVKEKIGDCYTALNQAHQDIHKFTNSNSLSMNSFTSTAKVQEHPTLQQPTRAKASNENGQVGT